MLGWVLPVLAQAGLTEEELNHQRGEIQQRIDRLDATIDSLNLIKQGYQSELSEVEWELARRFIKTTTETVYPVRTKLSGSLREKAEPWSDEVLKIPAKVTIRVHDRQIGPYFLVEYQGVKGYLNEVCLDESSFTPEFRLFLRVSSDP